LQEEKQKVRDEIGIMNSLEHPKLLQLAAAYENPREIIMNMEYIGGGELFEKVRKVAFPISPVFGHVLYSHISDSRSLKKLKPDKWVFSLKRFGKLLFLVAQFLGAFVVSIVGQVYPHKTPIIPLSFATCVISLVPGTWDISRFNTVSGLLDLPVYQNVFK
jgi:serine/threonine protein kinase